jgi:outer membrane lipoprotein LolB
VSACSPTPTEHCRRALLPALLLLSGCATQTGVELPGFSDFERRAAVLGAIDTFEFSGRIAVRAGDDGFNGRLRWHQDEERFEARVGGPLGIGTVSIEGNGDAVEITDSDGTRTVLEDVEVDLYDRYGWTIPIDSLRYWALGIPDPRVPADTSITAGGELTDLKQRGWQVQFDRYRDAGGGQPMPTLMTAVNLDTRVRLVIDKRIFHEL